MVRRFPVSLLFGLCFAIALFVASYPLYVIRPFRHQGTSELALALAVLRIRPWIAVLCIGLAIATLYLFWRAHTSRRSRIAAAGIVAATAIVAASSFINVYELMFHPAGKPVFESASQTALGSGEMVLAIQSGGAARAYPIRAISYHHIVNDVVGGVPIVATY